VRVVWNSFNGRYSDNPRVLYEAMRREADIHHHVWLSSDRHAATFPHDTATVPIGTPAASAALESADLVVANCHLQLDAWRKRADARYLQTWHGTPLKRIHRSAVSQPGPGVMDEIDEDISRWDLLIAPSRPGAELLSAAFGYHGTILETGYPRNDLLNAPDRDQRRRWLRDRLEIPEDATAVLYAPTYRDDDVDEHDTPLPLDTAQLMHQLGGDFHLMLRRHYFLDHREPHSGTERVHDVSSYPEISELYLAADVLVSDYSSTLFDFAVTGKPIVLYAYDLEHYRDRLRGFTLDLMQEAPGPIVLTQSELLEALSDLAAVRAESAVRYQAFRSQYCALEDGHATERVLEYLR
jgi:CDP-glycerol glycerophosphotransferase